MTSNEAVSGVEMTEFVRGLIRESFSQSRPAYDAEIERARALTGIAFSTLRPVFINGYPEDVKRGEYLLFLGLNPKLDVRDPTNTEHYADLDRDANSNEKVTLGYLRNMRQIHPYFVKRAYVVRSYARARGAAAVEPDQKFLSRWCLFAEFIPYHSEKTDRRLGPLESLDNVRRARRLLEALLRSYPPACIVLDGNETHDCVRPLDSVGSQTLAEQTGGRDCRIRVGRYRGIPVLKCGFIGSIRGVNSIAQREELGRVIAGLATNEGSK